MSQHDNMPTSEEIEAWKEKYLGVFEIEIEGYRCWLRSPDLKIFKHAFTSLQKSDIDFQNALINNCWLAGDSAIREDEDNFNALCDQIDVLIDIPEYQIEINGASCKIRILDFECELKKPSREDIRLAQVKNHRKQPFDTNINLLNKIWIKGDEELRQKDNLYISLLQAVSELETHKVATVKKL